MMPEFNNNNRHIPFCVQICMNDHAAEIQIGLKKKNTNTKSDINVRAALNQAKGRMWLPTHGLSTPDVREQGIHYVPPIGPPTSV